MTAKNSLIILAFLLPAVLSAPSLAAPFEPKGQISKPQPAFDPSELSSQTGEDAGYQDIAGIGSISAPPAAEVDTALPGACDLRCGGASDDPCFCDKACEANGDCCADKAEACDDDTAYTTVILESGTDDNSVRVTDLDGDTDTAADARRRRSLQAWRNFIMLLARIGEWGQENLGMNGIYDGRVSGGVGGSAGAVLDLTHSNREIIGYGFAMQRGLTIDAGFVCGGLIDIPVSAFPVEATQGGNNFTASGSLTRNLLIEGLLGFFPLQTTISYDLELDSTDLETLTTHLLVDLPWPCLDTRLFGIFTRRPL
jgi:hypothetical protein